VRTFSLIVGIGRIGSGEKPHMGSLALASLLAHLAIALSVQAQVLETNGTHDDQSVYSPPVSDSKTAQIDADRGLRKPTDLRSLCQTIASAAAENDLPFEFFVRKSWPCGSSIQCWPTTRSGLARREENVTFGDPGVRSEGDRSFRAGMDAPETDRSSRRRPRRDVLR
jgi:hypothetical protein